MTKDVRDKLAAQYGPEALVDRLTQLLAHIDEPPTPQALAPFDQFHTGGLAATMRIGDLLALRRGARVLDLGSGLGGPARYFAAAYGAQVDGIDLSEPFVDASRLLTERSGIPGVRFTAGDINDDMPVDERYDAVTLLHVAMNVADRVRLYERIARALRPGGAFVTYDVVRGSGEPEYPVPWATTADVSFLQTPDGTRAALEAAGLRIDHWHVDGERAAAAFVAFDPAAPPPLGVLLGLPDMGLRIANLRASLEAGVTAVLMARTMRDGGA